MERLVSVLLKGILIALACQASACTTSEASPYKVGGLYSVKDGPTRFKIAKMLAIERGAVHIRLYKNTYPERPGKVDPSTLSLGSITDKDGFGMGHLPLDPSGFAAWEPIFLMETTVTPAELEGYRIYKQSSGSK